MRTLKKDFSRLGFPLSCVAGSASASARQKRKKTANPKKAQEGWEDEIDAFVFSVRTLRL